MTALSEHGHAFLVCLMIGRILTSCLLAFFSLSFAQAQMVNPASEGVQDWLHVLSDKESLHSLCQKFGIDPLTLKQYNSLQSNKLKQGDTLRIPISPFGKMEEGACQNLQFYKRRVNQSLDQISLITKVPVLKIKEINSLLGANFEIPELLLIPYVAPKVKIQKIEDRRVTGVVSMGHFAANSWDGSKKMNYSLNVRAAGRYGWEYKAWKNTLLSNFALGLRHEIGRQLNKNLDQFDFSNQIQCYLHNNTSAFVFVAAQSQFFKTHFFRSNGDRILSSNLMAPAYANFALGLKFEGNFFNVDVGLYELKTTYVLDQSLYADETDEVYGVPYGQQKLVEHGMSLRVSVYYYGGEKLSINGNVTMFSNTENVEFYLRNDLTYRISKRLRLSMLTQIQYDIDAAEHAIYRNEVVLGYSFLFR